MKAYLLGWSGIKEIPLGGIEDHLAQLLPGVTLGEDSFADSPCAETAIFFLRDFEDKLGHAIRVRVRPWPFKRV